MCSEDKDINTEQDSKINIAEAQNNNDVRYDAIKPQTEVKHHSGKFFH